jgi:hypothetical protein
MAFAPTLLVTLFAAAPTPARDLSYSVGASGWSLERFGSDIAILRAKVTAPSPNDTPGLLLLSCEGAKRRLRLQLPAALVSAARPTTTGYALIAEPGPPRLGATPLVAAFSLERGATMAVADSQAPGEGAVLRLSRLLQARPTHVNLLLRFARPAAALKTSIPVHLALVFGAQDGVALDDFVSACAKAGTP